jgi:hypothetical protein
MENAGMSDSNRFSPGDTVYVVWNHKNGLSIEKFILELVGHSSAVVKKDPPYEGAFAEYYQAPLNFVFATREEAKAYVTQNEPKDGDYIAYICYGRCLKGLVVKSTKKMIDVLFEADENNQLPRLHGRKPLNGMTHRVMKSSVIVIVPS